MGAERHKLRLAHLNRLYPEQAKAWDLATKLILEKIASKEIVDDFEEQQAGSTETANEVKEKSDSYVNSPEESICLDNHPQQTNSEPQQSENEANVKTDNHFSSSEESDYFSCLNNHLQQTSDDPHIGPFLWKSAASEEVNDEEACLRREKRKRKRNLKRATKQVLNYYNRTGTKPQIFWKPLTLEEIKDNDEKKSRIEKQICKINKIVFRSRKRESSGRRAKEAIEVPECIDLTQDVPAKITVDLTHDKLPSKRPKFPRLNRHNIPRTPNVPRSTRTRRRSRKRRRSFSPLSPERKRRRQDESQKDDMISMLMEQLHQKTSENEEIRRNLLASKNDTSVLLKRIDKAEREIERNSEEKVTLMSALAQECKKREDLLQQHQELSEQRKQLEGHFQEFEERSGLLKRIKKLESQLAKITQERNTIDSALTEECTKQEELLKKHQELNEQLKTANQNQSDLQSRNKELEEQLKESSELKTALYESLEQEVKVRGMLEEKYNESIKDREKLESRCKELSKHVIALGKKKQVLEPLLVALRKEKAELQNRYELLRKRYNLSGKPTNLESDASSTQKSSANNANPSSTGFWPLIPQTSEPEPSRHAPSLKNKIGVDERSKENKGDLRQKLNVEVKKNEEGQQIPFPGAIISPEFDRLRHLPFHEKELQNLLKEFQDRVYIQKESQRMKTIRGKANILKGKGHEPIPENLIARVLRFVENDCKYEAIVILRWWHHVEKLVRLGKPIQIKPYPYESLEVPECVDLAKEEAAKIMVDLTENNSMSNWEHETQRASQTIANAQRAARRTNWSL